MASAIGPSLPAKVGIVAITLTLRSLLRSAYNEPNTRTKSQGVLAVSTLKHNYVESDFARGATQR